jgi:hypothetical protein
MAYCSRAQFTVGEENGQNAESRQPSVHNDESTPCGDPLTTVLVKGTLPLQKGQPHGELATVHRGRVCPTDEHVITSIDSYQR